MIFTGGGPVWFLGFDALLEVLFLLITGIVAWYAFRVYKLSGQRRFLWWGVGFLSITGAYAVNAFANYYLYARIVQTVAQPAPAIIDTGLGHSLGNVAHVGLFLTGYLLLALVALKFDDTRLITLFAAIVALLAVAIVMSRRPLLFTAALTILIGHIFVFTWLTAPARKKEQRRLRRLILTGFGLLLLGQVFYLFMPIWGAAYVSGHVSELAGYGAILTSMVSVLRT